MANRRLRGIAVLIAILGIWLSAPLGHASGTQIQRTTISGTLDVIYGDSLNGAQPPLTTYLLRTDAGQSVELALTDLQLQQHGGALALRGKRIRVSGIVATDQHVQVDSLQPLEQTTTSIAAVTGAEPTVSIMCRFSDALNVSPHDPAWVDGAVTGGNPSLDDYYREVSYNNINLTGSTAYGWYNMPHPLSYYVYVDPQDSSHIINEFDQMVQDCTAAADADVDFRSYSGINLLFNESLLNWSWGGTSYVSRDGASKVYRTTWLSDWSWENQSSFAHEMGHGFGLPHSSGPYGVVYDSQWDVMSDTWRCSTVDPTYGCVGPHTISFHKDLLGWIPANRKYVATPNKTWYVGLQPLALPDSTDDLMIKVPIKGSSTLFYTVERRLFRGYDVNVPGEGVIIHQVDTTRGVPAQVVDADNNGNPNDAGAIWTPGEVFHDVTNGITISVDRQLGTSMMVGVEYDTDLSVTQSVSKDPVSAGTNVTYTVNVTNNGPNTATQVSLADALPAGSSFVSGNFGALNPCSADNSGIVHCSLSSLAVGSVATAHITAKLNTLGTNTNSVSVDSLEVDNIAPLDNSSQLNSTVSAPTNNAPVADNQTVSAFVDTQVDITLNASDADHNPLTYAVITSPQHGNLSGVAPNLTYTPLSGYQGPDSFTFVANDGVVDSTPATVTINVVGCARDQYLAQYFSGTSLSGTPLLSQCEQIPLEHDWSWGAPASGIPSDSFSARWTGTFAFDAGTYQFNASANDGIRLYVDGQLEINQWQDSFTTRTVSISIPLAAGDHTVKVEYYEHRWAAEVSVDWQQLPDCGTVPQGRFCADYFSNPSLAGSPVMTRFDPVNRIQLGLGESGSECAER